jgi:hypothetical protein
MTTIGEITTLSNQKQFKHGSTTTREPAKANQSGSIAAFDQPGPTTAALSFELKTYTAAVRFLCQQRG